MIPDHLIDKGVDALITPARTTDMVPDWRLDVYRDTVQRIIEAVAADIWAQGFDAGCEDVLNHQDTPTDPKRSTSAYRNTYGKKADDQ